MKCLPHPGCFLSSASNLCFMKLTLALIAAFAVVFAASSLTDAGSIHDSYGFSLENFMARPYVFITSLFLHGSLEHLLSNVLALAVFGLVLEPEIGWKKMLVVFL